MKIKPAGRIGDFGNFLNGLAKSLRVLRTVLNIEWMQFFLKNFEILHFAWGLYDKNTPHITVSPQMWCIKSMKCWFTRTQTCWQDFVERKKFGQICFPRTRFPGLMYCDQEPLWLLNVIEDDCYILGVYIRLWIRCKISKITYPWLSLKSHTCALKLTDLWITVYCLI